MPKPSVAPGLSIHRRRWTCWLFFIALLAAPEAEPSLAQTAQEALWTGQVQCRLNMKTDGYAHQEIQIWTMNGQPRQQGAMAVYPGTWSAKGEGATQQAQGTQTVAARWSSNVPSMSAPIAIFVRASDKRLIIKSWHSPLTVPGALTGFRQMSVGNASPTQANLAASAVEWPFPDVEDDAASTTISGSGTVVVSGNLLPMQMASAKGIADCKWQFSKGAASLPGLDVNSAGPALLHPSTQPNINRERQPTSGRPTISQSSTQNQAGGEPGSQATGSPSSTQTPPAGEPGDQTTGSKSSTQTQAGGPLSMNPPTPTPAAGTVVLQWTAPASTGTAVDAYEIDLNSASGTTQQTIAAPATTTTVASLACPYPNVNCTSPKTIRFRVRAHTSTSYGPYSNYTQSVRSLISYSGDNISSIWATKQCNTCHTQSSRLNLSGSTHESYSNIVSANVATDPAAQSKLLACPTGFGACTGGGYTSHPGGQNFAPYSKEYSLILRWIQDGRQP